MDFVLLVLDAQHFISLLKIGLNKVLVTLSGIISEYDELGFRPTMSARSGLVQSSQSQSANVTSPVIARGKRIMDHRGSTYKADFSFNILLCHILSPLLIALFRFGIFGRANTKAAPTSKTRRYWYVRCCCIC